MRKIAICKEESMTKDGLIYLISGKEYKYETYYDPNIYTVLYKVYYDGKKCVNFNIIGFNRFFMNTEELREFQLNKILQ